MKRFMKLGLPSLRDETWRYTDLRSVAAQSFAPALCETRGLPTSPAAWSLVDPGQQAATLTMVNGCPLLDGEVPKLNGVEINSIRDIYKRDSRSLARFFDAALDAEQRRWVLLNTALFIDGLYLKITAAVPHPS